MVIVGRPSPDDPDRTKLVKYIVELIDTGSQTDKTQRKVEILSDMKACKRKPRESPGVFANRYKTCISWYINQSTVRHKGDDLQWEFMLLRNTMLTPDKINAIPFQLTSGANSTKRTGHTVTLNALAVKNKIT